MYLSYKPLTVYDGKNSISREECFCIEYDFYYVFILIFKRIL